MHSVADAVTDAAARLTGVALPTPLQPHERLSAAAGANVWLKREDLQIGRSYKLRGAYNLLAQLDDTERAAGAVCASAGNHGQGVAYACRTLGIRGRVHVPSTTPRQKRERIAALGGDAVELVVEGDTYDEAAAAAAEHAARTGATVVPAFDDLRTIAGQGTVGVELLAQLGRIPDVVVVPVGGGGLLAGVGGFLAARYPQVRVVGVEPAGAASMAAALAAGGPVVLPELDTFVDGAAVRRVGDVSFPLVRDCGAELVTVAEGRVCTEMLDLYQVDGIIAEPAGALAAALAAGHPVELAEIDTFVDGAAVRRAGDVTYPLVRDAGAELVTVPEGQICTEMLDLYQVDGIIAEPAGALASAALTGGAVRVEPGQAVVCVLSGGNNDVSRYAEVVERSLVHRGLKHYFLVEFPQEPGALRRFLDEVLGPDDDIVLFEYVKRDNRETGAALTGIELGSVDGLPGLLARVAASPLTIQHLAPGTTAYRFLV